MNDRCSDPVSSFPDFDDDNEISLDDLIETVQRLTGTDECGRARIDLQRAKDVARMVRVHSCRVSSNAATKDGIAKRLILLPKSEAVFYCSEFPVLIHSRKWMNRKEPYLLLRRKD